MQNASELIDLGAFLAKGRSPFPVVEGIVSALEPGATVRFAVPFEPVPLYAQLEAWGSRWDLAENAAGFVLTVTKQEAATDIPDYLDLRAYPLPEPFVRTMQAYEALPVGSCLIAHLPHRPTPLLSHLDAAGIRYEEQLQEDESCQIYLMKESGR